MITFPHDDYVTDAERWSYLKGARFVGPDEWLAGLPQEVAADRLHLSAFVEALADAADDNGVIRNWRKNEWYVGPLSDRLRTTDDPPGWSLAYDRFAALTLLDLDGSLTGAGYLAARGNGDSYDRRLCLPQARGEREVRR